MSFPGGKDGNVELKPISNGHSKTSRSGSIISILSNGTNVSNGVLKNNAANMSPENLKSIESAFTTNRDEYASFEASMDASAPKLPPTVIVTEGKGNEKKTALFLPTDPESESHILIGYLGIIFSSSYFFLISKSVHFQILSSAFQFSIYRKRGWIRSGYSLLMSQHVA